MLYAKSLQSCLTLCDPMDVSPPGSSVHGILQTRILEQVAISYSRGSSQPRDRTCSTFVSCIGRQVLYLHHHLGRPYKRYTTVYTINNCVIKIIVMNDYNYRVTLHY